MGNQEVDAVVSAVRERISEDADDAARFEVGPLSAGEEDGVVYVPIRYRETIDASRRYELYVRLGAIEADVRAKTGRALALLPGLPPDGEDRFAAPPLRISARKHIASDWALRRTARLLRQRGFLVPEQTTRVEGLLVPA